MNIKSLLLGSAAALAAVSGAHAADAIVAAEPEPMEYVRVCDAFGTGYFYIPGTETCLKVGGYVRFDAQYGNAYSMDSDGTYTNTRAHVSLDTASDTEWGALKTRTVLRFDYNPRNASSLGGGYPDATRTRLNAAYITWGGFLVGLSDSQYVNFIGYEGNVINDDVVSYGPYELNQASYIFDAGNGFKAVISLEDDGNNESDLVSYSSGHVGPVPAIHNASNSDWPDVVAGVKYDNGTIAAAVVGGYDESAEEGAIKAKLSGTFGAFSAFISGAWNTDGNTYNKYAPASTYGTGYMIGWGDWALWGGAGYKFTDKVAANFQVAYTDNETLAVTGNVQWTPVAGLLIQPEVSYTKVNYGPVDEDQWQGMVRLQRTF